VNEAVFHGMDVLIAFANSTGLMLVNSLPAPFRLRIVPDHFVGFGVSDFVD